MWILGILVGVAPISNLVYRAYIVCGSPLLQQKRPATSYLRHRYRYDMLPLQDLQHAS